MELGDKVYFFGSILFAGLIGFSFGAHYVLEGNFNIFNIKIAPEIQSNLTCSGNNLFNTSKCLRNELKTFYKYNSSNIGKKLSLEALKEQGGVCEHYSQWYKSQIDSLKGFYGKEVIVDIDEEVAHQLTVISNEEGYCILDQTIINCFPLKYS